MCLYWIDNHQYLWIFWINLKSKCTWKQAYQPVTLSPPLRALLHILLPTSIICPPEGISSSLIWWARLSKFARLNPIWFGNVLELYWWKRWIWKLDLGMGTWDDFGFKSRSHSRMVCEMIYVKGCIPISVVSADRCKEEGPVEIRG